MKTIIKTTKTFNKNMDTLDLKKNSAIWTLDTVENDFQRLYDHYRSVHRQNEWLREENERLKSEAYKDEELSKMKERYDQMSNDYYRGFSISEEEDKKIHEWIGKQTDKRPGIGGVSGGRFTYQFTPTGLGTFGIVIDGFTGDKFTFQEIG